MCNAKPILQLATLTNAVIGPSPAQRRAATSKNPTPCTLPGDVAGPQAGNEMGGVFLQKKWTTPEIVT